MTPGNLLTGGPRSDGPKVQRADTSCVSPGTAGEASSGKPENDQKAIPQNLVSNFGCLPLSVLMT